MPTAPDRTRAVRIANASGFYGDRVSAAREVVHSGPVDVLTGDWLAELTMLILARGRERGAGYARTFLDQMDDVLGHCLAHGIRVVSNAGGVQPQRLAEVLRERAQAQGLSPVIAFVDGDDVLPRFAELTASGEQWRNLDTGERFADTGMDPFTVNAYLGGFGIAAALEHGADVVVTGRVTDASLVVGPGAWWHGWSPDDLDALAGATTAGHLVECGAQVTGGNYALFDEVPDLTAPGFPVVELAVDGSAVVTKQPGTGGLVSLGTVTAQLLYEVDSPRYLGPDVVARFDTAHLEQVGPDRVALTGVRGEPPPDRLKVALNALGGYRTTVTFVLTGSDLDRKAEIVVDQLFAALPDGRDGFDAVDVQLLRHGCSSDAEPADQWSAQAELRVTVRSTEAERVGRDFTSRAVELTLASVPGLFLPGPPPKPAPFGVFWPTTVDAAAVPQHVHVLSPAAPTQVDLGHHVHVRPQNPPSSPRSTADAAPGRGTAAPGRGTAAPAGPSRRRPFGAVVGARSGDKGGNANVGVWVRHDLTEPDAAFGWLLDLMQPDAVRRLIPEAANLPVDVYPFPNVRAVNVVLRGFLGRGVAENTGVDPQAKGLGEYLRARLVDVPDAVARRRTGTSP